MAKCSSLLIMAVIRLAKLILGLLRLTKSRLDKSINATVNVFIFSFILFIYFFIYLFIYFFTYLFQSISTLPGVLVKNKHISQLHSIYFLFFFFFFFLMFTELTKCF